MDRVADRAATYARVSERESAKHGYSLPEQQGQLLSHCQHHGYVLVEHIQDGGISGELSDRDGLNRLLDLVDCGAVDVVVVLNISRLSRIHWEGLKLAEEIRESGVRVEWVQHGGGADPEGELQEGIHASFARFQIREIQRKTKDARHRKAAGGEGRPPRYPAGMRILGLDIVHTWEAKMDPSLFVGDMRLNEAEADLVRAIFDRYEATGSQGAVVDWLLESGHRTKTGGTRWYKKTVRQILMQTAYVGRLYFGKSEHRATRQRTESGRRRVVSRPKDPSEWKCIPCPPIVSEAQFARVQELLARMAETSLRGRPSTRWLLRGCVFCRDCRGVRGEPLHCNGQRAHDPPEDPGRYAIYRCNSAVHPNLGPYCGAQVNKRQLEAAAKAFLRKTVEPGCLEELAVADHQGEQAAQSDGVAESRRLEKELAELDGKARNLVQLAAAGVVTDVVTAELAALDRRRKAVKSDLAALQSRLGGSDDVTVVAARARAQAASIRERWDELENDPALFQSVAQQMLRVTITPHGKYHIEVRSRGAVLPWETPGGPKVR